MMTTIRQWVRPPVFEGDEERTHSARLLYVILWTLILSTTLLEISVIVVLPQNALRFLLLAGIVDITSLGLLAVTRRGYTRPASIVLMVELWTLTTAYTWTAGGIHAPAATFYLILVFIVGLLLGGRSGTVAAVICSFTSLGIVYGETTGFMPPSSVHQTPLSLWVANVFFITIIISLQFLATNTIKNALKRAQLELTERRQIEKALRASEAQYRMLFEESPTGICLMTPDTKILAVNPAAGKMLGYSTEELVGIEGMALIEPSDLARQPFPLTEEIRSGKTIRRERTLMCKDRSLISVLGISRQMTDERVLYMFQDITKRKRAEEILRQSEERYRAVVENQTEFIVRWKPDGTRTFVNDAYCRYFRLSVEDAVSTSFMPPLIEEDRLKIEGRISRLLSGLVNTESYIQRVNKSDGSMGWQEWTDKSIQDESGQVVEFQSVGRDITERKISEQVLRESEEEFRVLVTHLPNATIYLDSPNPSIGTYYISPQINQMLGYSPEEWVANPMSWTNCIYPEDRERVLAADARHDKRGEPFSQDYRLITRDGRVAWIRDQGATVFDEVGQPRFSLGIMIDITERKLAEEKLRKHAEEMTALYDIGLTITSNLELDQILHDLFEKCKQLLPLDVFYIALYDELSGIIRHPLFYDGNQKSYIHPGDRNIETAPGLSGHVILSKKTLYLPDSDASAIQIITTSNVPQQPSRSYVGVPMLFRGSVVGVISVQEFKLNAYSLEQIRLLETIATQAAIAIENSHLYSEIQLELVERRKTQAELIDSEKRYRELFEQSQDGIAIMSLERKIIGWNRRLSEMMGSMPQSGDEAVTNVSTPDEENAKEKFVSVVSGETMPIYERTFIRANGTTFIAEINLTLVRDVNGNPWYVQSIIRDITKRKHAEEKVHELNASLEKRVEERTAQLNEANQNLHYEKARLEQYSRQRELMGTMTDLLQASLTTEEASGIVSRYMQLLFPNRDGALYLLNASETLEPIAIWGEQKSLDIMFGMNDCWALRRGRPYRFGNGSPNPPCAHVGKEITQSALCIPLTAQGENMGSLHISTENIGENGLIDDEEQRFIETITDSIALALANVRLRERLRIQSIRDGLTGLFNRRYLDETLPREIHRAERNQRPISVLMFDIDSFKKFNDTYGHDAGDLVLKRIAEIIISKIRPSDIACRYGGEEFTIILPDTSIEIAQARAESLREAASQMWVLHNGKDLGTITISIGVASYPQHGITRDSLIKAADEASYQAKKAGKNRVIVAE